MSFPTRPTPAPLAASAARLPYTAPRVTPLGAWTAITLVTSLPIGPGAYTFGPRSTQTS